MSPDDALALLARLLRRIAPEVDPADLVPGALLQEEFDLDSMDFLNLVTALHDEAGVEVPERDYPRLATVGGFVGYVVEATGGA
ncbi:MAG TPA: phosphopantetheine-binding protein [Acidimicrobiales bacterium]|nr:phosphopantetheine-binding protein [Acidimicrobiales bacterium]